MFKLLSSVLVFSFSLIVETTIAQTKLPNIIYILADDLGYGDVGAFNPESKIPTPNLDALAQNGMKFTDAHTNSAVCTPTRYGILTGRYAWRTHLQNGVLWSYSEPLITENRTTVADLLKNKGYQTACIGKWHLGLGWQKGKDGKVDFKKEILGGPTSLGFDYFYGITASLDIPPYSYIENNNITAQSIGHIEGTTGKGFWRAGPIGDDFKHDEVLSTLTEKAVGFINENAENEHPFFLYLPLASPHTPILPTDGFLGKSGINEYADFVMMTDAMVGKVMDAVKQAGIEQNTIVVFTSDNGVSPAAGLKELENAGHFSSYKFRGHKADIYEGGHRVPFMIKWPDRVKTASQCDATICLTDFMATIADLTGQSLKANEGEDSYSMLPLLKQIGRFKRKNTVHHSIDGNFAIRKGKWKLIFAYGSGGWSAPREKVAEKKGMPPIQLFNLEKDISEKHNVAEKYPKVVKRLTKSLESIIDKGRSRPGAKQANDVSVDYLKYKQAD